MLFRFRVLCNCWYYNNIYYKDVSFDDLHDLAISTVSVGREVLGFGSQDQLEYELLLNGSGVGVLCSTRNKFCFSDILRELFSWRLDK